MATGGRRERAAVVGYLRTTSCSTSLLAIRSSRLIPGTDMHAIIRFICRSGQAHMTHKYQPRSRRGNKRQAQWRYRSRNRVAVVSALISPRSGVFSREPDPAERSRE